MNLLKIFLLVIYFAVKKIRFLRRNKFMRYLVLVFVIVTNACSQSIPETTYFEEDSIVNLEDIVVTATKTQKRKTNSPIIINVINKLIPKPIKRI